MKKFASILRVVILLVCVACMGIALWNMIQIQSEYRKGQSSYAALEQFVTPAAPAAPQQSPSPVSPADPDSTQPGSTDPVSQQSIFPQVDFEGLRGINPDIVGWIYSEGTVINYPVVKGKDNSYYLHRTFDGTYNSAGCIFMECESAGDFSDFHTILYGHHMKNGSMFASITEYKEQEYFDAHPTMLLMTPEQNYIIRVYAGYVTDPSQDAWKIRFEDEAEALIWMWDSAEKSCFDSGVVPQSGDRIITLSTCSYEFEDARFVLLGILEPAS